MTHDTTEPESPPVSEPPPSVHPDPQDPNSIPRPDDAVNPPKYS